MEEGSLLMVFMGSHFVSLTWLPHLLEEWGVFVGVGGTFREGSVAPCGLGGSPIG